MAQAKQSPQSQQAPESQPAIKAADEQSAGQAAVNAPTAANPLVPERKPQERVVAAEVKTADPPAARTPGMKRFRLEKQNGEVSEHEAATVEDAIRELNSGGKGKVFTFKSLKVTEI